MRKKFLQRHQAKECRKITAEVKEVGKKFIGAVTAVSAPAKLMANDIADHPFKKEIEGILEIGVHGLENNPKGNFNPREVLSRGEYAIIMEDILINLQERRIWLQDMLIQNLCFPMCPRICLILMPLCLLLHGRSWKQKM